jgi:branched-chain amino acid transport system substrate-binding protein
MRRRLLWVVSCVALMWLVACGSSGAGSSGSGSGALGGAGSGAGLTGVPLRPGTITSPQNLAALGAGVGSASAAINKAGGVGGRPVEVSVCDNQSSLTAAGKCAGFAVDRLTVATVGVVSVYGGTTNPILEKAGLPGLGGTIQTASDAASPVLFPGQAGA